MKVSLIGLDLIFFWLELNFWPNLRPSLDQLEPNFFSRLDFKVSRLDQKNLSAGIKLLSTGIKFSLAGFNWNFWFQSGSLFSAGRGGRPSLARGLPLGGQRPPEFLRKFFCIFDFRKCPLRPPEGHNGPTWDPKNFPNWAGINFFLAGFKFFLAGFIFSGWIFFGLDLILFDPTSDLKTDPTDTFFALFCPFFALFGLTSYLDWLIFAHYWPFSPMNDLTEHFLVVFGSVFGPFWAPFWLYCGGYLLF